MKTRKSLGTRTPGFTLLEMLGVIIIIAVLAAILAPQVFRAVARSKVSNTLVAYDALKGAVVDYYSRSNSIPLRSGTGTADSATTTGRFDADLRNAGFIEKLVQVPIGSTATTGALTARTHLRSLTATVNPTVATPTASTGGDNYDLDANTSTADFNAGEAVVSLVIPGVALQDAIQINAIVDGVSNTGSAADRAGRCLYSAPANGQVTVYLYVGHH